MPLHIFRCDEKCRLAGASGNTIGGTAAGAGNVISGNIARGVLFQNGGTDNNVIQANFIGTGPGGVGAFANIGAGIAINSGANNTIGGTGANAGNVIANNQFGIIVGSTANDSSIQGNSIFNNSGMGIDLTNDGPTANDAEDADSGANELLNFPVLTNVFQNGANLDIDFEADLPAGNYRIEFFDNASGVDTSGFGEGETFVGSASITVTGAAGYESFSTTLTSVTASDIVNITVTATEDLGGGNYGSTSEFGPQFQGAGVITVTTTSDTSDGDTSSIAALLGNRGADGFVSLREAIIATNNTTNLGGNPDQIHFNIPTSDANFNLSGNNEFTIRPNSTLPGLAEAVIIDGLTQAGASANTVVGGASDAVLLIELDGQSAGASVDGLSITSGSTIRGLVLNDFTRDGIYSGGNNNVIEGNYIGTDVTGTIDRGHGNHGIRFDGDNNTIGGTTAAALNVIAGNTRGIELSIGANNNVVSGNFVGVDATGATALGNTLEGISLGVGGSNSTIGGTTAAERNIISGNSQGIVVVTVGDVITGNYIGTDVTGTLDLGNTGAGIYLSGADGTTIGGTAAGEGNVISGNDNNGVFIFNSAMNIVIQGNIIGLDAAGNTPLPNEVSGIVALLSATNTTIGGTAAGARNIISANNGPGVTLDASTSNNQIQGNYFGTDITGLLDRGNANFGISSASDGTTVGSIGAGNLIAGNLGGISLSGDNNQVIGNLIGTDVTGISPLGNDQAGILISGSSNIIGGTVAGEGNTIAFNTNDGVAASTLGGVGNTIVGNAIHSNGDLGIDLNDDGVSSNDAGDVDTGANNLQNFPVIDYANSDGVGSINLIGSLNSNASTNYRIEFFASTTADGSGFGEAQRYLGFVDVSTNGSGDATYNVNLSAVVADGEFITATATVDLGGGNYGDTSEFSQNMLASTVNDAPVVNAPGAALNATEQTNLSLHGTGFSVSDADEANSGAIATLNVGEGAITVVAGDSGVTITGGNGTGGVMLSGTIAQIDNLLTGGGTGTITYLNSSDTPAANTTLTVTVNDQGNVGSDPGLSGDGTSEEGLNNVTINIAATNDDPSDAGSLPTDIAVTEDVSSDVNLSTINLADPDAAAGSLTVTLTTSTGGNLSGTSGGGVTVGGSGTGTLTLDGTLANLSTFLDTASNITYLHDTPGTNGDNADTIQVDVTDNGNTGSGGGGTIALGTVNVDIGAVNNAPVNTVPGTQTVAEETQSAIAGISVADLDALVGNISTQLQVTNGVLDVTLSGAATISSGANSTNDLTVQGTVADVNATLASLLYTGNTDVVGFAADTLTVTTDDLGNTGAGGAMQDSDNVQIDITGVNDAPAVAGPAGALNATEQTNLAIEGTGFSVTDVDEAGSGANATLSVGEGVITIVQGNSGVTISGGNGTGTVTLTGTIAQLNNLLTGTSTGTITYLNGSDTPSASTVLTFTVSDQGNTGSGGPQSNGTIVVINVAAVNDAPHIDLDANNSSGQAGTDFANTFTEDGGPVRIADTDAALSDVDSPTLTSLQVVLMNQFDGVNELLAANTTGTGITATYSAGVLTLSGVDSVANYQQVLRTISYENTSQNPNTTARIIEFVADDGIVTSNLAIATVDVVGQNDAPVSAPESFSVDNDKTLTIAAPGLLGNDSDLDNDPLSVTLVSGPPTGTLTLNADGSFTYVPNLNFSGTTSFTYVANDGTTDSVPTTVAIQVVAIAAPPIDPGPDPDPPPTEDPGDEEPTDETPPDDVPATPDKPGAGDDESRDSGTPAAPPADSTRGVAAAETTFAIPTTDARENQELVIESLRAGAARTGYSSDQSRSTALGLQRFGSVDLAVSYGEFELTEVQRGLLWQQLDTLQKELESESELELHFVGTATVMTAAVSTGYVIWALRGSFLLASFLSTVPTWRSLDPLPIIESDRRTADAVDDDESLADIAQSKSRKDAESSDEPPSDR
ncbi:MAG: Ig-like domain-containing protein [Planctomycetota bacterium]|nr:Ig-like domain-containing protein [Planctomycetota bacterium]